MPVDSHNIATHELTSLKVRITNSPDAAHCGLTGIVRDETKNMLMIEVEGKLLLIPKAKSSFEFQLPDGDAVTVEGSSIGFRPEDRVKKGLRRW